MTEIENSEKLIEYLTVACGLKVNHIDITQNDAEMILSALLEKAEQSKGCEYCKNIIYMNQLENDGKCKPWKVKNRFCPMCGRPLGGSENG